MVDGPLVLLGFGLLQLARNVAIHAQTRKVFRRLGFSNISVNASFFGTAIATISFVIATSVRDSGEASISIGATDLDRITMEVRSSIVVR